MNLGLFNGRLSPFAIAAAKLCGRAYHPSQTDGLGAALELVCGDNPRVTTYGVIGGVPAWIQGVGVDGLCVAISGITSPYQALGIEQSYGEFLVGTSTSYFASWFWSSAVRMLTAGGLDGLARGRDVFLFGHSGGGGIALALASILRAVSPQNDVHVVTFGSPRCCTEQAFPSLREVQITRWMNTGDDAVRMPPRYLDLTDLSFLAQLDKIPLWARFVHCFGGIVLDQLGNTSPGDVPVPFGLLSVATLPSRYLLDNMLFGTSHAIAEYCRRLTLSLPPKIPGVNFKLYPLYDVGSLPIMFSTLESDIPMSLPIPFVASQEPTLSAEAVAVAVLKRQAFINSPLKRC